MNGFCEGLGDIPKCDDMIGASQNNKTLGHKPICITDLILRCCVESLQYRAK